MKKFAAVTIFVLFASSMMSAQYRFEPNIEVSANPVHILMNVAGQYSYDLQFRSIMLRGDGLPSLGISGMLASNNESAVMFEADSPISNSEIHLVGGFEIGKYDNLNNVHSQLSLDLGIRTIVQGITACFQLRVPVLGDGGYDKFRFTLGYT